MSDLRDLAGLVLVGVAAVVGIGVLCVALWLAWPDDGTSAYSAAANAGQLALVAAGLACVGLAGRAVIGHEDVAKGARLAVLALLAFGLWWLAIVA